MSALTIAGAKATEAMLHRVADDALDMASVALSQAFQPVPESARDKAPRRTGTLADKGIQQIDSTDAARGVVRSAITLDKAVRNPITDVPVSIYGRIVEYVYQPYIRPALDEKLADVKQKFEAELRREIHAQISRSFA